MNRNNNEYSNRKRKNFRKFRDDSWESSETKHPSKQQKPLIKSAPSATNTEIKIQDEKKTAPTQTPTEDKPSKSK